MALDCWLYEAANTFYLVYSSGTVFHVRKDRSGCLHDAKGELRDVDGDITRLHRMATVLDNKSWYAEC